MKIILAALPLSLAALAGAHKHSSGHSSHRYRHHRASGVLQASSGTTTCIVDESGVGQDSTPKIMDAFTKCQKNAKRAGPSAGDADTYPPPLRQIVLNGNYLVKSLLYTPMLYNVEIELTGTRKFLHISEIAMGSVLNMVLSPVTYSDDIAYWSKPTTDTHGDGSYELYYQNVTTFFFLQGEKIWLHGSPTSKTSKAEKQSTFNGNGQKWWDQFVKDKKAGNLHGIESTEYARPILLTIGNAKNVRVEYINFLNGPFWNIFITHSKQVTMSNINIDAVSKSDSLPYNTDGVDTYNSDDVTLLDFNVNNADDCVSLKPNSTNVEVGRVNCNGSHGISVGSLGQYVDSYDIWESCIEWVGHIHQVENVYIHDISMSNAQAGARIKAWPDRNGTAKDAGGGSGYVKNITFQNFVNKNVDEPLLITSCYMNSNEYCTKFPSKMTVSDVHYINVTGTSSGKYKDVVALLDCSKECTGITAIGTHLSLPTPSTPPVYNCHNVDSEKQLDFHCTELLLESTKIPNDQQRRTAGPGLAPGSLPFIELTN
ncbi:BQ5605_C017g08542 [Microbotryum silenes-dioicae]|uniref:galacturonan 1,4-alpha-galacturonidase n=1 Tax=Microbotryum silenes-dioicae TaxID=796604 RepID=A0A2X0NYK8_9BASI|nr:BQ5605_C017g08542 [Microbotryum silenes-dioicae]